MSQKPLEELNACTQADFVAALANIFEYSPWVAEQAFAARPFAGVNALFAAMKTAVEHAPENLRLALIKSHPDLADKTKRADELTAESSAEQNSVGLDRLSDAEYEAFERVNNAYRAKFGFPYIVCVRRHTRDSILSNFEQRLPNDAATETSASIAEICRIAKRDSLEEAIEALSRRVPYIAVKLGPRGSVVQAGGKRYAAAPVAVAAVDTIGAGDSFNAGFLLSWLRGLPLDECARAGNITGALSTQRPGGTEAFRDHEFMDRFLKQHGFPISTLELQAE